VLDRVLKIRETLCFKECWYEKGGYFHPTCHGWMATRLVLEERKESVIGEVEAVSAHQCGEVVLASEESRTTWGMCLNRYRL